MSQLKEAIIKELTPIMSVYGLDVKSQDENSVETMQAYNDELVEMISKLIKSHGSDGKATGGGGGDAKLVDELRQKVADLEKQLADKQRIKAVVRKSTSGRKSSGRKQGNSYSQFYRLISSMGKIYDGKADAPCQSSLWAPTDKISFQKDLVAALKDKAKTNYEKLEKASEKDESLLNGTFDTPLELYNALAKSLRGDPFKLVNMQLSSIMWRLYLTEEQKEEFGTFLKAQKAEESD